MAFYLAVVPDDDLGGISQADERQRPRSLTPPTPPVLEQSFTVIDLKASISPSCPQTEVISMYTGHLRMTRYMNMSNS
jgi:hypothetical protein